MVLSNHRNYPVTPVKGDNLRKYFAFSQFIQGTAGPQDPRKGLSLSISLERRVSPLVWSVSLTRKGLSRGLSTGTLRKLGLSVKRTNQVLPPIRPSSSYSSKRSSFFQVISAKSSQDFEVSFGHLSPSFTPLELLSRSVSVIKPTSWATRGLKDQTESLHFPSWTQTCQGSLPWW